MDVMEGGNYYPPEVTGANTVLDHETEDPMVAWYFQASERMVDDIEHWLAEVPVQDSCF